MLPVITHPTKITQHGRSFEDHLEPTPGNLDPILADMHMSGCEAHEDVTSHPNPRSVPSPQPSVLFPPGYMYRGTIDSSSKDTRGDVIDLSMDDTPSRTNFIDLTIDDDSAKPVPNRTYQAG